MKEKREQTRMEKVNEGKVLEARRYMEEKKISRVDDREEGRKNKERQN